jgi:hypothetical protein
LEVQKFSRRFVLGVIGALALVGTMQFSPAQAQINPGPSVKGKFKGTATSTEGNGKSALSFKVTKDKDLGGARQIKGNGKFKGSKGKGRLQGTSSSGQWVVSLIGKGRKPLVFQMGGQVSEDGNTISGNYQIQKPVGPGQTEVVDEGTYSVTRQ